MHEKNKTAWRESFFSKDNRKMGMLAAAVIGALLIGSAILAAGWSQNAYVPLFRELSGDDMASVLGYLQEQDAIDYKVEDDDTILVRKNQRALLKAQMLAAGYPSNFIPYYNVNAGALETSGDRDELLRLDLQERLSDAIEDYDNVQEAADHLSAENVTIEDQDGNIYSDTE